METFAVIIEVIFGILGLILFFKVWAMTNDVRELKDHILPYLQNKGNKPNKGIEPIIERKDDGDKEFASGTIVVEVATGRQLKIKHRLPDGRYKCSYNNDLFETKMDASDLVTLEEYQAKKQ